MNMGVSHAQTALCWLLRPCWAMCVPTVCVCLASLSQVVAELCVIGFEGSAALTFWAAGADQGMLCALCPPGTWPQVTPVRRCCSMSVYLCCCCSSLHSQFIAFIQVMGTPLLHLPSNPLLLPVQKGPGHCLVPKGPIHRLWSNQLYPTSCCNRGSTRCE